MLKIRRKIGILKMVLKATVKDFRNNWKHQSFLSVGDNEQKYATLRMYAHMLDKALNNPSFEKGHSMTVYKDAKRISKDIEPHYKNDPAFAWVLKIIESFEKAQESGTPEIEKRKIIDYTGEEKETITKFIRSRTSCRNFEKRQISEQTIKDIVSFAVDAPNGCCRQTARFYITQNQTKISQLVPNIAGITNFTNIQGLVAVCAESSFYALKDKNLQYVDASLSAENFILAAGMYGIYGTMCNFFHASPKQVESCKKILFIKETENIVMFIALGYPVYIPEKPIRRELDCFCKIVE